MQLALFRQHAGPRLAPEGLVFELASAPAGRFLSVSPAGEVTLFLAASEGPQRPSGAPGPANRPTVLPDSASGVDGDPAAPEGACRPPLPDPDGDKERERVRLAGRLGADPRFRETRNGVLVGSFPIAVRQEDGSTRWETVVAFQERAAKLRGEGGPRKGQHVEVIGYRHRREQPTKDGTVRVVEEVYAVVVKAP